MYSTLYLIVDAYNGLALYLPLTTHYPKALTMYIDLLAGMYKGIDLRFFANRVLR